MIILGGSYYNGPKSIFTGTAIIKDVNKIVLQNGIYDRLYVSNDISKQEIVDTYTSEAAKSVKIESGINRIETIDVYGKTTQEGTGDASPSNVREIENAGALNKLVTFNGTNATFVKIDISSQPNLLVFDVAKPDVVKSSKGFSTWLPMPKGFDEQNGKEGIRAFSASSGFRICVYKSRLTGETVDAFNTYLKANPLTIVYQSTEDTGEFYTGIEITQGDEYRCEIIGLKDCLHEGDTLETNVQSEFDKSITLDETSAWSLAGTGAFRLAVSDMQGGGKDVPILSNRYIPANNATAAIVSWPDKSIQAGASAGSLYVKDTSFGDDVSAFKQSLKTNPLKVWYKSASGGTGKNVRRETHVKKTLVLTGTENIQKSSLSNNSFYINFNDIAQNGNVGSVICNQAKAFAETDIASSRIWGVSGSATNTKTLRISSPETTVDAVKAKFAEQYSAGIPFIIEYELAQPEVFADELVIVENKAGEYTVLFESTGRVKLKPVINQEGWSDDTIIDAGFNGDLAGGNVDFTAESIDKIRIKRRKKGTANWVDLKDIIINVPDDFTFTFYDLFAANAAEYTYAVVPVIGDIEGNLSTVDIQSMFNGFFIADKNTIYGTEYNVNVGAATKNEKSSVVQTLGAKYPFIIDNGYNNYYTVPISLFFYNPNLDWQQNVQYRQTIVEWLHNGTAKIFKSEDGRIWLAKVTTAPVLTPGSNLNITSIDFSITEIGESNSTEDLYNSGLLSLIKES